MAMPRRRRLQLRTRVLAGVLAVTVVVFVAFDAVAVAELRRYLVNRVDNTLQTVLALSSPHLDRLFYEAGTGRPTPVLQAGLGTYNYLAFVPDRGSTVVFDAEPGVAPEFPADLTRLAASHQARTVAARSGSGQLRLRAQSVTGGTLVATASLHDVNRTVRQLLIIAIIGTVVALAVIALGVILVVRRGLRPLESMASQADRINAGDLTHRVGDDDPGSEVGRLATALNGMLGRIEASVQEREADQDLMRRFFADASHELRTPLASLRANAELYQQGVLSQREQVDEAMRRIELEAQRMSRLVDDMLRLARLDQHPTQQHDAVDLSAVLEGCVERARLDAVGHRWRSEVAPGVVVDGDEELLRRAVDNLVANVHAHTPPGTTATLSASRQGPSVVVDVTDDGPGVPEDRLPRIFDRFYRADTQSFRSGSGLGLAIVREIAAAHEGNATAALEYPHGLRVTLHLPAVGLMPLANGSTRSAEHRHDIPQVDQSRRLGQ
jgi:two-component system, OmpR family, sensor kinase